MKARSVPISAKILMLASAVATYFSVSKSEHPPLRRPSWSYSDQSLNACSVSSVKEKFLKKTGHMVYASFLWVIRIFMLIVSHMTWSLAQSHDIGNLTGPAGAKTPRRSRRAYVGTVSVWPFCLGGTVAVVYGLVSYDRPMPMPGPSARGRTL